MRWRNGHPFFYGWVIVVACFSAMSAQSFVFSFGVFYRPLMNHFGWTAAEVALTSSLQSLVYVAAVLPVSWIYQRLNGRAVVLLGGILMGSGLVLSSQAATLSQLYFSYGIVAGIGSSTIWVPFTSTLVQWFKKRRGVVMAIALSGHGVGNLITAPLLTYIILVSDWRAAFLSAGAIILLVVTLAALAMKDTPGSMGLRPYGETQEEERRVRSEDKKLNSLIQRFSVREILGRREFWLIYILWIVSTIVHTVYTQHLVLFAIGVGITAVIASLALGTIGLSSIIGRLTMGLLLDRIGITRALVICYTINVGSALLLMITKSESSLFLFAFTFGFSFGGRTTLEVPLASSFVGLANLGIMSGMFETAFGVGGFIGPYLGGRIYDMLGQYYEVFLICTLLSVLSLAITLILRPEKKDIT